MSMSSASEVFLFEPEGCWPGAVETPRHTAAAKPIAPRTRPRQPVRIAIFLNSRGLAELVIIIVFVFPPEWTSIAEKGPRFRAKSPPPFHLGTSGPARGFANLQINA